MTTPLPPGLPTLDGYGGFLAVRERLAALLTRVANALAAAGAEERARRLADTRRALESDAFRLLVLGEFKRGKSTLINALLGDAVLPARVAPCTGLITELAWGETPAATLYPADGGPPRGIPVDRLREYVLIREEDEAAAPPPSEWTHIRVAWPLPLLHHNVEIVDSPGLNEHGVRDALVLDYLPRADALILVLSCEQQLSASELAFLDQQVGRSGVRHTFLLWNRFDAVSHSPVEVEAVRALTRRELEPRLGAADRVFYLSARDALRARRAPDLSPVEAAAALSASGLPAFEAALEHFLTTERGRVKLGTPLRAGELAVREALAHHLPERERLLAEPVEALRARYLTLRPRLDALHAEREALLRGVERRRATLAREVATAWQAEAYAIADALPAAAAGIDVKVWDVLRSSREARRTVADGLRTWLEDRVHAWEAATLRPLCDRHLMALDADLDARLHGFLRELREVHRALSPSVSASVPLGEDVPPLSRVLGAVGGFFLGGLGAAIEGVSGGVEGMMRGLGYHVALGLGLVLLGASAPVILAASAVLGLARTAAGGVGAVDRLRADVAREMGEALRKGVPDTVAALEGRLAERFSGFEAALDGGMRVLVDEVDAQVRAVLAEKERGEATLAAERLRMARLGDELLALAAELDTVRAAVG